MSRPHKVGTPGKPETRNALIDAAAAEIAASGIDGASLNAICARAGFTRGAFYVHFGDRDDLLVAVIDRMLGGFVEVLTAASAQAEADLERIVMTVAIGVAASTQPLRGTAALRFHHILAACDKSSRVGTRYAAVLEQAVQGIARAVEAGQKAGTLRNDADADTVAKLLVTMTLGLIASAEAGLAVDPLAVAQALLAMLRPV
jgi:AcrR family transcriptional regulator